MVSVYHSGLCAGLACDHSTRALTSLSQVFTLHVVVVHRPSIQCIVHTNFRPAPRAAEVSGSSYATIQGGGG